MTEEIRDRFEAIVASVLEDNYQVVINRRALDEVKAGDRYLIFAYGPEIQDPITRESLGKLELVRGRGSVVRVQDKLAVVESLETRATNPGPKNRTTTVSGLAFNLVSDSALFNRPSIGDLAKLI